MLKVIQEIFLQKIFHFLISAKEGRRTSFEVTVNDTVIHSKLSTMNFPDVAETVAIVKNVDGGAAPSQVIFTAPVSGKNMKKLSQKLLTRYLLK